MKITNQTKNKVLAENAIIADYLFGRMKGLLGKGVFREKEALVLKPCNSIHTFFMKFPIDVLFIDKNLRIIKIISSVKPFRLSGIYFGSRFAVELPAGTVSATSTSEGDTIRLE